MKNLTRRKFLMSFCWEESAFEISLKIADSRVGADSDHYISTPQTNGWKESTGEDRSFFKGHISAASNQKKKNKRAWGGRKGSDRITKRESGKRLYQGREERKYGGGQFHSPTH